MYNYLFYIHLFILTHLIFYKIKKLCANVIKTIFIKIEN